ncbi:MAG: alkaline phosphatase family protein, partial [Prevotella sp.]|nr:alkaline phosphatase family protein [Prevotella sp.]
PVINGILDFRVNLNHKSIAEQGLSVDAVKNVIIDYLCTVDHVIFAVDFERVRTSSLPERLMNMALMGYHPRRSGDILIITEPNYYMYSSWSSPIGTTHGEWNPHDAHIPLLFYGWHVEHGATSREVHITDIAPTVCQMLHIQQPNACSGEAITEITK